MFLSSPILFVFISGSQRCLTLGTMEMGAERLRGRERERDGERGRGERGEAVVLGCK